MEKDKQNLQELLAAIKKDVPQQPGDSFGLSMTQVPNSSAPAGTHAPPSSLLAPPAGAAAQNPFDHNFSQLVDVLRNSSSSSSANAATAAQSRVAAFPTSAGDILAASQLLVPGQPIPAGLRKPPIPNPVSTRPQQHRDVMNQQINLGSVISMPLPSGPVPQTKSAAEITSELTRALVNPTQLNTLPTRVLPPGVKQAQSTSSQAPAKASSQPHLPSNTRTSVNPAAARSLSVQSQAASKHSRSSTTSGTNSVVTGAVTAASTAPPTDGGSRGVTQQSQISNSNAANRQRHPNRPITQEQVIVGHFCRHSLKLLARVLKNNPNSAEAEDRLKGHIKKVWAQWVKDEITRPQLLESVATFVRGTAPETSAIDVVRDFKIWYEREFELQCQRNARANPSPGQAQTVADQNAQAARQLHHVQKHLLTTSSNQGMISTTGLPPQTTSTGAVLDSARNPVEKTATTVKPQPTVAMQGKTEDTFAAAVERTTKAEPRIDVPLASSLMRGTGAKLTVRGRGVTRGAGKAPGKAARTTMRELGSNYMKPPSGPKMEPVIGGVPPTGLPQPAQAVKPTTPPSAPASSSSSIPQIDLTGAAAGNKFPSSKGFNMSVLKAGGAPPGTAIGVVHIDATGLRPGSSTVNPDMSKAGETAAAGEASTGVAAGLISPAPTMRPEEATQVIAVAVQSVNKSATAPPKGKQGPKPPPARPPVVESPSRVRTNIPGSPADSGRASSQTGTMSVGEKRPFDAAGVTSPSPNAKKLKNAKAPKPPAKKKASAVPAAAPGSTKTVRPPPAKLENLKKGSGVKAGTSLPSVPGSATTPKGMSGTGSGSQLVAQSVDQTAAPSASIKRGQSADVELNVTTGVVDIEEEENRLATRDDESEVVVVEENIYSENMLFAGGKLRSKMQGIAKRFLLDENLGSDVLEMVSLAAEERLRLVIEKLKEAASIRIEKQKSEWDVIYEAASAFDKVERAIEDENRMLINAAQARVRNENERKEADLKKTSGESGTGDNKKESSAVGDAERKEKLAVEKKRKESSSQRDALTGLVDSFHRRERKRGSSQKGLAPLKKLGEIGSKGLGSLPPIPKKTSSDSLGLSGSRSKGTAEALERLGPLGPVQRGGRKNSDLDQMEKTEKEPVTLFDVLFFLQEEVMSRKSILYYKWATRVGVQEE